MSIKHYPKLLLPILALFSILAALVHSKPAIKLEDIRYREYKLMLRTDKFTDVAQSSQEFLQAAKAVLSENFQAKMVLEFDEIKTRKTRYIDTPNFTLYKNGFVLKEKTDSENGKPDDDVKISLKYRSESKRIADVSNVTSRIAFAEMDGGSKKFEEEIDARLTTYNRSAAAKIPVKQYNLANVSDLSDVFPVLLKFDEIDPAESIATVNAFTPVETVLGGYISFGDKRKIHTRLTFWALEEAENDFYMIEFSFSYATRKLADAPDLDEKSRSFFELMKNSDWVAPKGKNKENVAYDFGQTDNHALRLGK